MVTFITFLKVPLPTSNPMLAELHDRFAGDYLRLFDHAQTSFRAREVILKRLPDGEPRRDQVAAELHMSERTLQRRLVEEATSFLQWLDDTRRELAEQYLGRLHLSLAHAAYLLGFADQSSFFRACRRWFELSPGQYRSQLMKQLGGGRGPNYSPPHLISRWKIACFAPTFWHLCFATEREHPRIAIAQTRPFF